MRPREEKELEEDEEAVEAVLWVEEAEEATEDRLSPLRNMDIGKFRGIFSGWMAVCVGMGGGGGGG